MQTLLTVYLDQNKWIALAREFYGRGDGGEAREALAHVSRAVANESAVFPLSGMHYMETWRINGSARRKRLGEFMTRISQGRTFASYRAILNHELELAIARRTSLFDPEPFEVVGRGVSHAFGMPIAEYSLPEGVRIVAGKNADALELAMQAALEKAIVHGVDPEDGSAPVFGRTAQNHTFKKHIDELATTLAELSPAKQDDALYAISIADINEPITRVLNRCGLDWNWCYSLGPDGLKGIVDDLPSRRVDMHLHRQVLRNPQLRGKITDLEDWAGLGPAVAYCDVVVCERHFASLVTRDGFPSKATVTTSLGDLSAILAER